MDYLEKLKQIKQKIQKKNLSYKVNLIIVSKNQKADKIEDIIIKTSHIHFGENRLQEAISKYSGLIPKYKFIKLHFIGRIQSNKVREIVKFFDFIHSIDSHKLALKCAEEENKIKKKNQYFIQVNFDEDPKRSGVNYESAINLCNYCQKELQINIIGLMCIPPLNKDPIFYFNRLKFLKDNLKLPDLSMGMSNDYESAMDCGSTFVRVGRNIFG